MRTNQPIKKEYSIAVEDVTVRFRIEQGNFNEDALVGLTEHTHGYNELFVCLGDRITLEIDGKLLELRGGDAAIVPRNLPHHKLDDCERGWYAVGFLIEEHYGNKISSLGRSLKQISSELSVVRHIPEVCEEIHRFFTQSPASGEYLLALRFTLLLAQLAERTALTKDVFDTHDSDMNRLTQLDNIVNSRFMRSICQSEVAELLHISRRQLARIVQKRYGKTLLQVITEKRLHTAAKLLLTTDYSIDRIAADVGFQTNTSFYRSFKARYHMTPIAYRSSHRE